MSRRSSTKDDTAAERLALVACNQLHAPPAVEAQDYDLPHIAEVVTRNRLVSALEASLRAQGCSWVEVLAELHAFMESYPMPLCEALFKHRF